MQFYVLVSIFSFKVVQKRFISTQYLSVAYYQNNYTHENPKLPLIHYLTFGL